MFKDLKLDNIEKFTLAQEVLIKHKTPYVLGQFKFPVATPDISINSEKPRTYKRPGPKIDTAPGAPSFKGSSYTESNCIELKIPLHVYTQFSNGIIPEGTVFLVGGVGGELEIDKMNIIGVAL